MKKAEYRKYICEMVGKIHSKKRLNQIYTVIHRLYLHDAAENGEEIHITDGEYYRGCIDRVLDTMKPEEMKGIYLFLRGLNGELV